MKKEKQKKLIKSLTKEQNMKPSIQSKVKENDEKFKKMETKRKRSITLIQERGYTKSCK